jgi:hypothetical protein
LSYQAGKVAVVHATVVQLAGKFTEQPGPVATGRCDGDPDLHAPLDDVHR